MSTKEKEIAMRLHSNETGEVLAAADVEVIGKTLREGKVVFHVSKLFYHGELVDENELKEALEETPNANLVGEKVVNVAVEKGLIGKNNYRRIDGVPHAQIYKL